MTKDLDNYLSKNRARIEAALNFAVRRNAADGGVSEAMRYSLLGGGKRLRPILCLAAAETLGAQAGALLRFACGIECIHSYSLIHDDLPAMDDDDLRRGRPTCHKAFGEALAILAGDGLLTLAFELMSGPDGRHATPALRARYALALREVAHAAGYRGMVKGQSMDIYYNCRKTGSAVLRELHLAKTAALIEASVVSGVVLAGASPRDAAAMRRYGRSLGLAFQIVDDLIDVTGDEKLAGKRLRKDADKATYPGLYGVEGARRLAARETAAALRALNTMRQRDTRVLAALAERALTRHA